MGMTCCEENKRKKSNISIIENSHYQKEIELLEKKNEMKKMLK